MTDAPKEVWIDYEPYTESYAEVSETENSDTKYIREDECKAREEAAYKRGMEEAARIADEAEAEFEYSASLSANAAGEIARRIRSKIQEEQK